MKFGWYQWLKTVYKPKEEILQKFMKCYPAWMRG